MEMGEKLKKLRKCRNMTQQELADCVGVSRSAIKAIEAGISHPRHALLVKLCTVFNVTYDYMLDDSEECHKVEQAEEFTKNLINMLIEKGVITDSENIPPNVANMILSSLKLDIERALKEKEAD